MKQFTSTEIIEASTALAQWWDEISENRQWALIKKHQSRLTDSTELTVRDLILIYEEEHKGQLLLEKPKVKTWKVLMGKLKINFKNNENIWIAFAIIVVILVILSIVLQWNKPITL